MTALKNDLIRELTAEETLTVAGGRLQKEWVAINKFVHPLDIVSGVELEIVAIGR
jgi:hypothetical protein